MSGAGFISLPVESSVVGALYAECIAGGEFLNCAGTTVVAASGAVCSNPGCGYTSPCTAAPLPAPLVEIYDGTAGVGADPAFVGEYLVQAYANEFNADYADWRILPGAFNEPHPFQDLGVVPDPATDTITMANGTIFTVPNRPKVPKPFKWDGEYYGNPRVVDGYPDLGHDEIHLVTMAGSYSPNSTSHYEPGFLAPDLPDGPTDRFVIVRRYTPAVTVSPGNLIEINGTLETPTNPQAGWVQPPGTLVPPTVKTSLPVDYQKKWIRFVINGQVPLPWVYQVANNSFENNYTPPNSGTGQDHTFVRFIVTDDEGTAHDYFNTQGVVYDDHNKTTDLLRANLQVEYR